ncbi:hypothetical protein [Planotetraspora kaengkrachanensis]|uniref:Uncharacterized protein n=1 Tax=Planotetraspora kaengkrachanensis TaxID=575193 RepID=A0A8J3PU63_9ACTN|nr:hypothetical protein [Planotetraspora kaengkrachanensis]GIG81097.1 hypothetical protein Pka01_42240 [Planotetraspora kaengkrachanensis]
MAGLGLAEIVIVLVVWVVPAVAFFFLIYWAIRLAIRHEGRRAMSVREPRITDVRDL